MYNPNIPVGSDPTVLSQAQIRSNFQAINSTWSINHSPLTGSDELQGMHNVITLRPQSGDPTTASNQVALYNKIVSMVPTLFYRPSSDATPIQMTYPSIKADSTVNQYTFMAGPFLVHGGFIENPTNGMEKVMLTGSSLLYADLTIAQGYYSGLSIVEAIPTSLNSPTANSFTIKYQTSGLAGPFNVYYFAIGI